MQEKKTTIHRRQFLGNISKAGILGTLATIPGVGMAQEIKNLVARPDEGHVFLTKPYLQNPSPEGMSVMWICNKLSYSWVEYGEGEILNLKAHETIDGLVSAYNRVNCVRLTALKPATTYNYRIVSKEILDFQPYKLTYGETIISPVFQFTTPDPKASSASWLVMNDIHDRPKSFDHLMKLNGDDEYDFVFLNGDMFDYQTNEQQIIDHLLTPCTDCFASKKPFLFVRGNHETRGKFARELPSYFSNIEGQSYFSFQADPVFNLVLDTGEDKEDTHPVYGGIVDFDGYRRTQALWLEKQMQSKAFKKAKFRVVMMHIPHFYSGDDHGTLHCRELYAPLFDKYKIDLFIAGHTHRYGVFDPVPGNHSYPIIIGGGPIEGSRTLIKIKADRKKLQLNMLRDDGIEVGKYVIESKR
ncbi:MAG: FN3 domain-containing metallophosphoesterase family protein [Ginsengibacter sp.]